MNASVTKPRANTSLWSRFAEWVYVGRQPQDMTLEWSCCGTPKLDPGEAYLGRVDSSELSINACAHCGMLWLGIRSLATTVTRTEPFSRTDAEAFLGATPGIERRALMRAWLQRRTRPDGSRAADLRGDRASVP